MRYLWCWLVGLLLLAGCRETDDGPAADAFAVRGIDVSRHNGAIDFQAVAADGYDFVFIKASDGTDHQPRELTRLYTGARKAGLKVGLYHYFQFTTPPDLQALNIANASSLRPSDFPLIIDFETDSHRNSRHIPTSDVVDRLQECVENLQSRGFDVMIYSNKDDYRRYIAGRFDSIPLWICALNEGSPSRIPWTFWQHSHRGRVAGIVGDVDLNVFAGDSAEFATFVGRQRNKTGRRAL